MALRVPKVLGDLLDVSASSPGEGQALVFHTASGQWQKDGTTYLRTSGGTVTDSLKVYRSGASVNNADLLVVENQTATGSFTFAGIQLNSSGPFLDGGDYINFNVSGALRAQLIYNAAGAGSLSLQSLRGGIAYTANAPDASVAHVFDNTTGLVSAGSKLISVKNSGTEQVYVDATGAISGSRYMCGPSASIYRSAAGVFCLDTRESTGIGLKFSGTDRQLSIGGNAGFLDIIGGIVLYANGGGSPNGVSGARLRFYNGNGVHQYGDVFGSGTADGNDGGQMFYKAFLDSGSGSAYPAHVFDTNKNLSGASDVLFSIRNSGTEAARISPLGLNVGAITSSVIYNSSGMIISSSVPAGTGPTLTIYSTDVNNGTLRIGTTNIVNKSTNVDFNFNYIPIKFFAVNANPGNIAYTFIPPSSATGIVCMDVYASQTGTAGVIQRWFNPSGAVAAYVDKDGAIIGTMFSASNPTRQILPWAEVRALPTSSGDYVQLGSMYSTFGAHSVILGILVDDSGFSTSKIYMLSSQVGGGLGGGWTTVQAISDTGPYNNNDVVLEAANVDPTGTSNPIYLSFRIKRLGTIPATARVNIAPGGAGQAFTWVPLSGTGTSAAGPLLYTTLDKYLIKTVSGVLALGASASAPVHLGPTISDMGSLVYGNFGTLLVAPTGVDQTAPRTPVMSLVRDGTSTVVYAGLARFDMDRWASDGVNSRSRLHIALADTAPNILITALSLQSNGVVIVPSGALSASQGIFVSGNITTTGTLLISYNPDGATAIGTILDTSASYVTTGAKLFSIRNSGSERAYFTKDGALGVSGTSTTTPGNATLNAAHGRFVVPAGSASVVISSSAVTTASDVFVVLQSNDTTADLRNVVPSAGYFTVNLVAPTANCTAAFMVYGS